MMRHWRSTRVEWQVLNGTIRNRCQPGLSVPNLDEFHKRMIERNVPCIQEPEEVFGARVALYEDPNGLGISVAEERPGG